MFELSNKTPLKNYKNNFLFQNSSQKDSNYSTNDYYYNNNNNNEISKISDESFYKEYLFKNMINSQFQYYDNYDY